MMKHQIGSNFKLGLMVTAAMALFIVAVYLIGSKQNMFGESFHISAEFKNVNGLQTGNNVRYAGINVGIVDRMDIISDSSVEVYMKIDSDVIKFIKKDAFASIGSDGLVGNMLVNISPGSGDQPQVDDNDQIASFSRSDTDDILNTLSSTNENIAILSRNLLVMTHHINEGQGTITALLKDSTIVNSFKNSLSNLELATANSVNIIGRLDEFSEEINNQENLLNLILRDTVYTNKIQHVIEQLGVSSNDLSVASTQLREATLAISKGSGPINTLLHDSVVSNDLKQSISNIKESTILLNENMEAMRHNFLFRKYFKNLEKDAAQEMK
jgi:phospholipid/cholesterol/gamma-HCH transport system substrate-binding protein